MSTNHPRKFGRDYGGLFLVFEGVDGAGKSTHLTMLQSWLERTVTQEIVTTFEPGGTPLGQQLRNAVLHGEDIDPLTEALIYATDRCHHVESLVLPALKRQAIVISDRYVDSSIAYQGGGRLLDAERMNDLQWWATSGLTPDLTILLDLDTGIGLSRLGDEKDRLESEPTEFHVAVRQSYLALAAADPDRYLVVDASGSKENTQRAIRERVASLMGIDA